jgi:hypothetical protein
MVMGNEIPHAIIMRVGCPISTKIQGMVSLVQSNPIDTDENPLWKQINKWTCRHDPITDENIPLAMGCKTV